MVTHFENAVAISFRNIAHEILVELGVSFTSALLNHTHPSGVAFTGRYASECWIACLSSLAEQLQISRSPAQSIEGRMSFLPNRILPAEVFQLVVSLTLYVVGILLGYFGSYICRHIIAFLLSIKIRFPHRGVLARCKS